MTVPHSRLEVFIAFTSTLLLAIGFGTLPALSSILTSPDEFGLGPTLYGLLFVPQALVAMAMAFWETSAIRRIGHKRLLLIALAVELIALLLIFASRFTIEYDILAYLLLLGGSVSIGIAFGMGLPAGIALASGFFPERRDRAVLYLNGAVAFGPGIAPLMVAVALAIREWSLMPFVMAIGIAVNIALAWGLPLVLPASETATTEGSDGGIVSRLQAMPSRFWLYVSFIILYGIVQTLNGNWSALYITEDVGGTAAQGALALSLFWVALGIGRLLFGALDRVLPETTVFRVLPFVAAAALLLVALTPSGDVVWALVAFALTGLGCSALLPLTISFSQNELARFRAIITSALVAFYMVGFGIAGFVVGPLIEHLGVDPSVIYLSAAVIAVVLGVLARRVLGGLGANGDPSPAG